ncbi:MAG: DUF4838 domain-containing protein [Puniceicoccales bacterium]|jgi:hypothetical protein|nr:DUF4838 domain-containing protein [Puniceicoccales bacterium]
MQAGVFRIILFSLAAVFPASGAVMLAQPIMPAGINGTWLTREKTFHGKIHLPQNPAPEESEAAATLAHWIEKVTGAAPEISTETPDETTAPGIYVGATRQAALRNVSPPNGPGDAWLWTVRDRHALFLAGNSPLATRLAAGDFIRQHLGVTFLSPGEWGAEWTPRRIIPMPRGTCIRRPAYRWRTFGMADTPAQHEWMRNNGLGARPAFTHALHTVFDAETAAEHPEFFPVVNGVLRLPSERAGYEPQPKLAAPGAAAHAARRAAAFFTEFPEQASFPLGITDNMTWDESPDTRALAPSGRYFRGKPDYSNYVFSFMNRAATALWPSPRAGWDAARWHEPGAGGIAAPSPDKLLGCLAYADCERPPDFALHPNIFPVLTADRSQWRDPAFRKQDIRLIRRWARSGVRHFGLYDYYYGNGYLVPRIFTESQIESIRRGAQYGASLFYAEIYPNWGFDGPKAWLAAQLLQDPGQNATLLLRHYFYEAYGPAAAAMGDFFDIAERCWNEQPGPARWLKFWRMENSAALISPERQQQMSAALKTAQQAFPGVSRHGRTPDNGRLARQQMRVRATELAFDVTVRFLDWQRLREALAQEDADTPEAVLAALRNLEREVGARTAFIQALARWRSSAYNSGAAPDWDFFLSGDISVTVVARLLRTCAARSDDRVWKTAFAQTAAWAARRGLVALAGAAAQPDKLRTLASATFAAEDFQAPAPQSPLAGRPVAFLKPPWHMILQNNESTHFGFEPNAPGNTAEGFLRMRGCSNAVLSRDASGVAAGNWVIARAAYRGRVNPGTYAALELCFLDKEGNPLNMRAVSVIPPAQSTDWRPVVCLLPVPPGASGVRATIRCSGQEADEALDWNALSIESPGATR